MIVFHEWGPIRVVQLESPNAQCKPCQDVASMHLPKIALGQQYLNFLLIVDTGFGGTQRTS